MSDSVTPWTAACEASLSSTISQSLLRFISIESVILSNHLVLCQSLLLLPSVFPSMKVFSSESALCFRWPSTGASASAVLPMNIQSWFSLGLTGLISLLSKELSRVFSSITFQNHQFFHTQLSLWSNSHIHTWLLEIAWLCLYGSLSARWCFCFSICCSNFSCHSFPSKKQASFNFMAAVTIHSGFGAQENKICCYFHFFPFYLPWSDGTGCHDRSFFNLEFQATFLTLVFHPHEESL